MCHVLILFLLSCFFLYKMSANGEKYWSVFPSNLSYFKLHIYFQTFTGFLLVQVSILTPCLSVPVTTLCEALLTNSYTAHTQTHAHTHTLCVCVRVCVCVCVCELCSSWFITSRLFDSHTVHQNFFTSHLVQNKTKDLNIQWNVHHLTLWGPKYFVSQSTREALSVFIPASQSEQRSQEWRRLLHLLRCADLMSHPQSAAAAHKTVLTLRLTVKYLQCYSPHLNQLTAELTLAS